ncbi:MAG TPA: hypothetical protein VLG11_05465 [Candidatus Saccharimonadales bacterium]|nr:hypothetical protein [Candidatus Saccharimonadales bacterium]
MNIKTARAYWNDHWQGLVSFGSVALLTVGLLTWRLKNLVPGYSNTEVIFHDQAVSAHNLLQNPVSLPYTGLLHLALMVRPDSLLAGRLISALLGLVVVGLFYWLIQHWHGRRIAWMATILFLCSTRFLHTARLGTPQVLLFALFALIVYGVWLKERIHVRFALPAGLLLACLLVYVPGMIWFIAIGVLWQWRTIVDKIWKTPVWLTVSAAVPALALLFPLGWSIAKHPKLAETFLGFPQPFPHVSTILHNLLNAPLQLFYTHSTTLSDLGTPGLLTLDSFAIVLFIFGAYLYGRHFKLARTSFLLWIILLGVAFIALGVMSVSVLFPFIYVVVASGLAYLLGQWLEVFPRNIFARSTGIVLLSIVIAFCCVYNLRRYFVAWPTSATTRATFSNERP